MIFSILSAGDQINQTSAGKDADKLQRQIEYAGFLYSPLLRTHRLPRLLVIMILSLLITATILITLILLLLPKLLKEEHIRYQVTDSHIQPMTALRVLQDYIAARIQSWRPTYSVVEFTETTLTVKTYDAETNRELVADGNTDTSYTIVKSVDKAAQKDTTGDNTGNIR